MSKYFLSIIAIYRDEGHIMREWIEHYLAEGVDHFYLIDDGSSDGYEEILAPYIRRGLISEFSTSSGNLSFDQDEHCNFHVLPHKDESEWFLVVDFDEFAYAKTGTIANTLREELGDGGVNDVILPWIVFGSSGLERQPDSVVGGFRWRQQYLTSIPVSAKHIVRSRDLTRFGIHHPSLINRKVVDGCFNPITGKPSALIDESYILGSRLLLNHYQVQSREWFFRVKARPYRNRWRASWNAERAKAYFSKHDYNEVIDNTLENKRLGV
jgi:hypothetical protein